MFSSMTFKMSSHDGVRKLSQIPCIRALSPFTNHLPNTPPPNTITLGIRLPIFSFLWDTIIQFIVNTMSNLFCKIFYINIKKNLVLICICIVVYASNCWKSIIM